MKPTLLVLAAGLGSRYGGIKQIEAVGKNNECLLDYATYDAMQSGYGKVVYIIRKDIEKDFRERLFDQVAKKYDAEYVFQEHESLLNAEQLEASKNRSKPWGTLHAILCAKDAIKAPFAVINSDDFYGRQAIKTLGDYLKDLSPDSTEHAMVGYILGNTMSHSGSVSRGVCTVENGYLKSINENKNIYYQGEKIITEAPDGSKKEFTGKEWVSMNLFGFSQRVLDDFQPYWDNFIATKASTEKEECLLPIAVGHMLDNDYGKVKFFSSSENWFGMTYTEDRQIVRDEIAKKVEKGYYPERLY
ncbi:MAG: hypothetical protein K6C97_06320 [Treponema sp.]|nr:hypothetical protein [Treponema sp.]